MRTFCQRETRCRDDRFDLHAHIKPRREATDPGVAGWLMCRAILEPFNWRISVQSTPLSFSCPSAHSAPFAYVKADSNIANRKCIFLDLFSNWKNSYHPNIFIFISKINYTFYSNQTKWVWYEQRRWRYWYSVEAKAKSKTKNSNFYN